jgi:uncharacterized protein
MLFARSAEGAGRLPKLYETLQLFCKICDLIAYFAFVDSTLSGRAFELYIADTGLLCALLNIHTEEDLQRSPWAGAIWETFVFAQLRHRERRAARTGSLFFWRDRTREVDFVACSGGRIELFEAKWTELPSEADGVNLEFVSNAIGRGRIAGRTIVCRTPHSHLIGNGIRELSPADIK